MAADGADRVLIVEDDDDIASLERDYLEVAGMRVDVAADGPSGLEMGSSGDYDAIVLDVMLPRMNGFDVCSRLRAQVATPILMVSARTEDIDAIRGLGLGADDYVTKPFSPSVLVAKVKAQIAAARRHGTAGPDPRDDAVRDARLAAGDVEVDTAAHEVRVRGSLVSLTNREYELLCFLLRHRGTVFSRDALYERVWGEEALGDSATVMVHVNRIREKVERDPSNPALIQTVRGAGYIVRADDAAPAADTPGPVGGV
ncbi:MAG: response regulator transcription factor [Coriobacteriales bacterium]|jgi:DNA-binding response OmpR family regulator